MVPPNASIDESLQSQDANLNWLAPLAQDELKFVLRYHAQVFRSISEN